MRPSRRHLLLGLALGLAACSGRGGKVQTYRGPKVTSIQVHKAERKLYLLNDRKVLRTFPISLGFTPEGHKQFEGDGKTPEGTYYISSKNPNSAFHLSLYINYPNAQDRAYAAAHGRSPGGDVVLHGGPRRPKAVRDWTEGCVAVTDAEIEEIYPMVDVGTPIHIFP